MPKDALPISRFGLGMVTSIDPQDIPLESAIYSENLDNNAFGRLQGILANSLKSSSVGENAIGINNWLRRESGEHDLIYTDGANVRSIRDFYGTPTENQEIVSKVPTSMVRLNRGMHMGTGSESDTPPQFLGWAGDYSPFGGLSTITTDNPYGAGLGIIRFKGSYTGTADAVFIVETFIPEYIPPDPQPATEWRWKKDDGAWAYTTDIWMDYWWELSDGISVQFGSPDINYVGGTWTLTVKAKNALSMVFGDAKLETMENTTFSTLTPDAGKFSMYRTGNKISLIAGHTIDSVGSFSKRITAVNIYRSEDPSGYYRWKYSLVYDGIQESLLSTNYIESTSSFVETEAGLYKLIASHLIAEGEDWVVVFDNVNSVNAYIEFDDITSLDTLAPVSMSYEQNSGILENADTNLPYYELGTSLQNFHFVAKCYVNKIPDAKMMLFRSVEFCYDVFDVYNDKVPLNILPTAIAGFNNKIYVWDSNTTIIINASNLSIETVIHGTGCLSPLSWCIIDTLLDNKPYRALVFADSHDIYMDEGEGARPISDAIRTKVNSGTISWADMQHSLMNPILVFDAPKSTLLCISSVNYAGAVASVFAYHITSKRWDYYPDFCNYASTSRLCKSAFSGKDGETYSINGFQVLNNFGGTTRRAWKYYSPELVFGLPKQPKKFYNVYLDKIETSGAITPTYSIDKGTNYRGLTNSTEIKDVAGLWEKKNSIILALAGATGNNYVNAIELLHRKMVGVR